MVAKGWCLVLVIVSVVSGNEAATPPQWPDCYFVSGVLRLPYAEINEPFAGYLEAKKNRSRVDYYDLVQTFQIGGDGAKNFGQSYKVAPMTTEEFVNVRRCFLVNGTESNVVTPQAMLPDLTGFQMIGYKTVNEKNCSIWQNVTKIGQKKNVYTFYQTIDSRDPVRYEMIGYDSLLGSHYDKYYVDYNVFKACQSLPDEDFHVPANLTCGGFPGPGDEGHCLAMNPIREYIHHSDTNCHVDSVFHSFKEGHGKSYKDGEEHTRRKHLFHNNLRFIHSKNRESLGFSLAVNHLADRSEDEMRMMRGRQRSTGYNGALPFDRSQYDEKDVPDHIDWRLRGAVTPVKDQAVCGSCWSFGTTGVVEGAHFLKTGELVRLSQQELIDCSWGEGNNACDGGEDFRAYQWILKHGLASEETYGPYLGQDGLCHMKGLNSTAFMKSYVNVTSGDLSALRLAIAKQGPVSVGIDASHRSFSFYANGVYYEPDCGSKLEQLDHAVLAVGYGILNEEPFWLIKNSWSTYWGNDGYVLMSQKDNNCGVATAATLVIM